MVDYKIISNEALIKYIQALRFKHSTVVVNVNVHEFLISFTLETINVFGARSFECAI